MEIYISENRRFNKEIPFEEQFAIISNMTEKEYHGCEILMELESSSSSLSHPYNILIVYGEVEKGEVNTFFTQIYIYFCIFFTQINLFVEINSFLTPHIYSLYCSYKILSPTVTHIPDPHL